MWTKLMYAGKHYVQEMDLEDIAALKLCLISFGTLAGIAVPRRAKGGAACVAALAFVGTAVPIMCRFLSHLTRRED